MANGENFAGNLEVTAPDQTRRAQAAMHLRSIEERGVEIGIIVLQRGELQLQLPFAWPIT